MTRTTISLHESTLARVKEISRQEHLTIGETMTELLDLAIDLKAKQSEKRKKKFQLKTYSLGSTKVALEDKEAVYSILDGGKR